MKVFERFFLIFFLIIISQSGISQTDNPGWTVNIANYGFDGDITAKVIIDGTDIISGGILAAFVNNECRGVANEGLTSPNGNYVFIIRCYTNSATGDTLSFKFYDSNIDLVFDLKETIEFAANMIIGNAFNPFIFHNGTISNDATLSNLKVDGTTVEGFDPSTLTYNIELPYGTTTVPTVTATTSDQNATAVITPAASLPGTTTIVVTAEDGTTTLTYSVNFSLGPIIGPGWTVNIANYGFDGDITAKVIIDGTDITSVGILAAFVNDECRGVANEGLTSPNGNYVFIIRCYTNSATGETLSFKFYDSNIDLVFDLKETIEFTANMIIGNAFNPFIFHNGTISNDATLSNLKVDGATIEGFDPVTLTYNVELSYGTITVPTITAITNDQNASLVINQATTLPGTAILEVTAEDGTTTLTYSVNFTIGPNNDATLSNLKVDGATIQGFDPATLTYNIELPYGTTTVPTVTATTNDQNATAVITPATSLPGSTTVEVTAEDGATTLTYSVNFTIGPSNDVTLSDLKVDGTTIQGFNPSTLTYNIELPYGTTTVPTVTVTTNDQNATSIVNPAADLPGQSTIKVTAEDGTTTLTYTVNFTLEPSNDATLSDLKVDGTTVEGFDPATLTYNIELPYGTTTVPTVTATTNDQNATAVITPAASLPGTTTVKVTAEDETTTLTYSVNFTIGPNNDASLSNLKVDGATIQGFDPSTLTYNIDLSYGTTTIPIVTATTSDQNATTVVNPAVILPGTTTVEVTAEDGTTTLTYTVNFTIGPSNDVTLSDLKVDGTTVQGFDPTTLTYNIELPYGTTTVPTVPTVTATTSDQNATAVITPATSLPGTTTVDVTAEDETTTITYTVNFTIGPNNDTTLSDLKVDGTTVEGFDPSTLTYIIELPYGTTTVPTVTATTSDQNATAVITSAVSLPGTTTVEVTAEDGTTTLTYSVNFSLGPIIGPGWTVNIANYGFDGDITAKVIIDGTDITSGGILAAFVNNECRGVTNEGLTSPNGNYVFIIRCYANSATGETLSFKFYDSNIDLVLDLKETIEFTANMIIGNAFNPFIFHNGTISNNATLTNLKVDGTTVQGFDPATLTYNIELPYGTITVPTITAITNDQNATAVITPAASLPGTTTVEVTAEDETTTLTYSVNFTIGPNNDASLSNLKVDGSTIQGFDPSTLTYNIDLPYGTTTIPTVTATTSDQNATTVVNPAVILPGTTTVEVTAEDGTTTLTYTVNFTIGPSNDVTLSDLKVDGTTVQGFDPATLTYNIELPYGTITVPTITAITNDQNASLVINQATTLPGTATLEVTAEDGTTTLTYSVNFTIGPNNDATLSNLKVDGTTVEGFDPATLTYNIELPYGTTTVPTVTATTSDQNATAVITPSASLPGTTTVEVTAEDGTTTLTYTLNFTIGPNNDATLSDLKIDGTTIQGFDPATLTYNIELPYGTTTVPTVTATTSDQNATAVITPAASLPGTTTVEVTAEDGTTTLTYSVNFTIGPNNLATLVDLKVDGTTVEGFDPATLTYNIELPYGTTTVPIITATTSDQNATAVITPAVSLPGTTTVEVTAEDETTTLTYSVNFLPKIKENYPDWTSPTNMQNTMTIHAQVLIFGEGYITSTGSLLAAFKDRQCRGVVEIINGPAGKQFLLSIGAILSSETGIAFKVYDYAADEVFSISETIDFENNTSVGTIGNPVLLHAGMTEQIISLVHGWNWLSFNTLPEENSLTIVLGNYPAIDNDEIKTAPALGGSATYWGGTWYGLNDGIQPGVMYLLNSQNTDPGYLSVTGYPVEVSTPISIVENWNWIGYNPQESMDLATAIVSLSSENNDEIKTAPALGGSATYYGGIWYGLSGGLQPGVGYLLNSSKQDVLIYPDGSSSTPAILPNHKDKNKIDEYKTWINPTGKKYTMTIHAKVALPKGDLINATGSKLAAFKDGVCRGVFEIFDGPAGKQFQLSIGSDLDTENGLNYRVFNTSDDKIYNLKEKFDFILNSTLGKINEPVIFSVKSVFNTTDIYNNKQSLISKTYPNPFNNNLNISFTIISNEKVIITVFDTYGRKISTLENRTFQPGTYKLTWNGQFSTMGVYYIRMETEEYISIKKVVKLN